MIYPEHIGICIPSRGLIYSKVIEGVFNGIEKLHQEGLLTSVYISNDLPIPDAHNSCLKRALDAGCERIIFVEEDNYIGESEFLALATFDADIATLQYNDKNGSPHGIIHYNEANEIIWCGLGATSIKRGVFERIGGFRTDTRYKITKKHLEGDKKIVTEYEKIEPHKEWNPETLKFEDKIEPYVYGGLDIDFMTRARKEGYKIEKIPDMKSIHLKVVKMGEPFINNGVHQITSV
jgi:hypothetical protein